MGWHWQRRKYGIFNKAEEKVKEEQQLPSYRSKQFMIGHGVYYDFNLKLTICNIYWEYNTVLTMENVVYEYRKYVAERETLKWALRALGSNLL